MWQRGARGGSCGSGFVWQWFRRGRGEPASSRRFCNIFMQSEVRREGGKERGGKEGGRKERGREEGERVGKREEEKREEVGRKEGDKERGREGGGRKGMIVTSSKLLCTDYSSVVYISGRIH